MLEGLWSYPSPQEGYFKSNHIPFHPNLLDVKLKHDVCHSFVPLCWKSITRLAKTSSDINGWKSHEIKGRVVRLLQIYL